MKLQSAVEFLTTYSFLIIVLSAAILVVFFLVGTTKTAIESQCVSFSSIACNDMSFYSQAKTNYSIAIFSITNSQNAPINVTNITVTLKSVNYIGICAPSFLYQGQEATCMANLSTSLAQGSPAQGFYAVNAKFCDSPVGSPISNCTSKASYGGSFYAYSQRSPVSIFSVIAGIGNSTGQLPAYNAMPLLSTDYPTVNNGDWVAKQNATAIAYALGTVGYSGNYFGVEASPFPSDLYYLDNNAISCSSGYNSTISYAYTAIYLNANTALSFNAYADNAIATWYRPAGGGWTSVYGSSYWPSNSVNLASNSISLAKGLYSIAVGWSNSCGPGLQAFELTGSTV